MEAIILAGGLGTRLRSEVADVPKSMAKIQSRPFLEYLLDQLIGQGITKVIFSVGYKSEFIQDHFQNLYNGCAIEYAVETTQLGTGGAIKNAMPHVKGEDVVITNGDSIFIHDLQGQIKMHCSSGADVTMALKPMQNIERYGTVELTADNRIVRFNEKQPLEHGVINTGVYIFKASSFLSADLPVKFSIEKEFFETYIDKYNFVGFETAGYFLDIGIPVDFKKAQYELGLFTRVNQSWTLFLDRDGVINKKRDNDYVKSLDELELLPGAVDSIAYLSKIFGRVVIVTNQQGIGKGLMSTEDLNAVHGFVNEQVHNHGGKIDCFYHAPQLASESSKMRKPEIGMALQAKSDFPDIDFSKSIMVGDSPSDIEFAKRADIYPVFVGGNAAAAEYDYSVKTLSNLAETIRDISRFS